MARRNDHNAEELKELAINAAWKIVGEEGFEAVSARRVASEIGYAAGTVYNLFESMDDLLLQVSSRTIDMLHESILHSDDPKAAPEERLRRMALCYGDFAENHRNYWLMLFLHTMPDDHEAPDYFKKKVGDLFLPLEDLLTSSFQLTDYNKARTIAKSMWGAVHGICFLEQAGKMQKILGKEQGRKHELLLCTIDIFIQGLKK